MYEIKMLVILLLRQFDVVPDKRDSPKWRPPQVHRRSIGVIYTDDEVFVQLRRRQLHQSQE